MNGRTLDMAKVTTVALLAAGFWRGATAWAAATHYVAPAGSDGNGGTGWGDAWATIGHAVTEAETNSVILVSNGVYEITAQITLDKAVTVQGVSGNPSDIVVDGQGSTTVICFYLSDAGASVASLTATNAMRGFHLYYGGTVSNCISAGHRSDRKANGVYCQNGGLVTHCLITGNLGYDYGGGACLNAGGTLRNCLIVGNESTRAPTFGGGGGVLTTGSGGLIENCTITRNTAKRGGGVYATTGLTLRNSIIYGNRAPTLPDIFGSPTITYCCVTPLPPGAGNTAADPVFADSGAGDFRLLPGSAAMNSGAYQSWMGSAVDLDGQPRTNGVVDMGCYEYAPGALDCGFAVSPATAFTGMPVVLSGAVAGTNTASVTYAWDFDGDGNDDLTGLGRATVTNTYAQCGRFAVRLRVTNGAGESRTLTRDGAVAIGPAVAYVARAGNTDVFPYDTWATAASNVQDAVDAAVDGSTVWVEPEHYLLDETLVVGQAVALRCAGGAGSAILDGDGSVPCLYLDHAEALVDGFTMTNGASTTAQAAGVHVYGGGVVTNCTIIRNVNTATSGASGFYIEGIHGVLTHSRVLLNSAAAHAAGGGIVVFGTVRNCLVAGNQATTGSGATGGIAIPSGGLAESCTIVGNLAGGTGGVKMDYGLTELYNCIVVSNVTGATVLNWAKVEATITAANNCTTPTIGTACITEDPAFRNPGAGSGLTITLGDYRLADASPCRDQGLSTRPWLAGSVDLAGDPRLVGSAVDIGAFEWQPPGGTTLIIR